MSTMPPSAEEGRSTNTQLEEEEETMSRMSKEAEEILKNIPTEVKWGWTARTHMATLVIRGETMYAPLVGEEKWTEIIKNLYGEGGKILFPMVKENFNVQVENAMGADDLVEIVTEVTMGPGFEGEQIERTPERCVYRTTKCPWWDLYEEYHVDPKFRACYEGHQEWGERGLKAVDPRLTHQMVKGMTKGDPYCEYVIEFKK
jgi:hypothetical protein